MKKFLIVLLLSLIACGPDGGPYNILVDSEFTEEEENVIRQVFLEWYAATGSDDALVYAHYGYNIGHEFAREDWVNADESVPIFHKVRQSDSGYFYMKDVWGNYTGDKSFTGFAKHGEIIAVIPEAYYKDGKFLKELFHGIVLHEVSHFIGLDHGEFEIRRSSADTACLTNYTIETFCDIYDSCYDCAQGTCF